MLKTRLLFFCLAAFVTHQGFSDDVVHARLTKPLLQEIAVQMDKANNTQDAKTLLSMLSDEVVITITFPKETGIQAMTLTKKQYAKSLEESWAITRSLKMERLKTQYEISEDGQSAKVTSMVRQSATLEPTGEPYKTEATQVTELKHQDGAVIATKVDIRMY